MKLLLRLEYLLAAGMGLAFGGAGYSATSKVKSNPNNDFYTLNYIIPSIQEQSPGFPVTIRKVIVA